MDKKMKELSQMLGSIASTAWKSGINLAFVAVGGGLLYYFNYPLIKKLLKFRQFSGLSGKKLIVPAVFPIYVENPRTVGNIDKQIEVGPGVIVFWGPPDSGKTSYAIRTCNKLLQEGKIGGVIKINDSTFAEYSGDGGVHWLNTAFGVDNLLLPNEKISDLIPSCEPSTASYFERFLSYFFRRNKRVVILFDQFDNVCEHSNSNAVLTFIKRLAEDSVLCNSYNVLLCVTNPKLAKEILQLNGGKKIRLLQKPRELQWGKDELTKYFTTDPSLCTEPVCAAGTPGFCVDILQGNISEKVQTSKKICQEWKAGDFLENLMK